MKKKLLFAAIFLGLASVAYPQSLIKKTPAGDVRNAKMKRLNVVSSTSEREGKAITTNVLPGDFKLEGKNLLKTGIRSTESVNASDSALYLRPKGFFMTGYSLDYSELDTDILFGYAYSPFTWQNRSSAASYSWVLPNVDWKENGDPETVTSTENNPVQTSIYFIYPSVPGLTANFSSGQQGTYRWGGSKNGILVGGNVKDAYGFQKTYGQGNYDKSLEISNHLTANGYAFGTTNNYLIDGLLNTYEKSPHTYLINNVWIHAAVCSAPANTKFRLIIHRMNQGVPVDTIATSVVDISAVERVKKLEVDGFDIFAIPFTKFSVMEGGISKDVSYLEIKDQIGLELTGFNKQDVKLSVLAQRFSKAPDKENNAYVFSYYTETERILDRYPDNTSLLFNMNATYPFLFVNGKENEDIITYSIPSEGGSVKFDVTSLYHPDDFWTENLPDWLTFSYTIDDYWNIELKLEAAASPDNGRQADFILRSPGSKLTFKVSQGVGISESEADKVKVVNTNEGFDLSYPLSYKSVSIYNVSGQFIANYLLPVGGQFIIPSDNLTKGMYLLKLEGDKTKVIKVIR